MSETPAAPAAKAPAGKAPRPDPEGIVFVDAGWDVAQFYRPDPLIERFFEELKSKRLIGSKVRDTGRVIYPPQSFCEITYKDADEVVTVGPAGVIRTFTVVHSKFGNAPPAPYAIVFVQLDGASTASGGYLRNSGVENDPDVSLIGKRCKAVFKDEPAGEWTDFWFELE